MRVIIKKTKKEKELLIIIPKKEILNRSFKEIEQDLVGLLKKNY